MIARSLRALCAAFLLLGLSGCALHDAMHGIAEHYETAKAQAEGEAYADADAEVSKVERIVASDDVAKAKSEPRFVELHGQLVEKLAGLRVALQAEDAAQATLAFEQTSATCKACHEEYQ